MDTHYTSEKHVQILIALLKEHKIRYVIVSPGATNVVFVASIQSDPFFTIYSSVDERSAAYMACGLAAETGVAVVYSHWMMSVTKSELMASARQTIRCF